MVSILRSLFSVHPGFVSVLSVAALLLYHTTGVAQVIDFEDAGLSEGDVIADQYVDYECGVRFYLDSVGSTTYPVIAEIGGDRSYAFDGPNRSRPECGVADMTRFDMMEPEENVGCKFLTTNEMGAESKVLYIHYTNPTLIASGDLLDIDGEDAWMITAYDGTTPVGTPIVLDAMSEGAGNGKATYWQLDYGTPFTTIEIRYTGAGDGVSLALDNFSACSPRRKRCLDFDDEEAIKGWYGFGTSSAKVVEDAEHGKVYQLVDGAGASAAINDRHFSGNWLELAENGCLCFDYRADWNPQFGSDDLDVPRIQVYTGDPIRSIADYNNVLRAFPKGVETSPGIENGVWKRFCFPIGLCTDGELPSNEYMTWGIQENGRELTGDEACEAWNRIIQNVTGIFLQTDFNSEPSEKVYFDNFCWTCEGPCDGFEASITADGSTTFCEGESRVLTAEPSGATYQWSTGETTRQITVRAAGIYSVDVTSEDECRAGADIAVAVLPLPDVEAGPDVITCYGESVQLAGTTTTQNVTHLWTPNVDLSCTDCTNPVATPEVTTMYFYTVTNQETGCSATDSVKVTVRDSAGIEIVPSGSLTFCEGGSVVLTVTPEQERYQWSTGETTRSITVQKSGLYRVEAGSGGACTGTAFVEVNVARSPKIDVGRETTICLGGDVELFGIALSGNATLQWTPGDDLSCTDCPTPIATPKVTTMYYCTATNEETGCSTTDSVLVTVRDSARIEIVPSGSLTLCEGGSVELTVEPAYEQYRWSTGETTRSIIVERAGRYTVEAESAGICSGTGVVEISVLPAPEVNAGQDVVICPEESAQLAGSSAEDNVTYQWSPADGLSCTDCPNPVAMPEQTTTYTLTVTSPNGCTASDEVRVEVNENVRVIRAMIDRAINVQQPGEALAIPVQIQWPQGIVADEVEVEVEYDQRMMLFTGIDAAGTRSEGWTLETQEEIPGRIRFRLLGAPRNPGSGTLIYLRFRTFLSEQLESELPLRLSIPDIGCLQIETIPGHIRMDSICGLSFRLVESTGLKYSLANTPNPFNPATQIEFTLGLDGPTTLVVYDVNGQLVQQLVNEHLDAGAYSFTWDANGYPSGLYYCRMTSGHWSAVREMVVVK